MNWRVLSFINKIEAKVCRLTVFAYFIWSAGEFPKIHWLMVGMNLRTVSRWNISLWFNQIQSNNQKHNSAGFHCIGNVVDWQFNCAYSVYVNYSWNKRKVANMLCSRIALKLLWKRKFAVFLKEIQNSKFLSLKKNISKLNTNKMGRRSFSRICEIKYPSRVEGWLDICGKWSSYSFVFYC